MLPQTTGFVYVKREGHLSTAVNHCFIFCFERRIKEHQTATLYQSTMARSSFLALLCLIAIAFNFSTAAPSNPVPIRPGFDCYFTKCSFATNTDPCKEGYTSFGSQHCKSLRLFKEECCKKV
ncbi:hypothetical protein L596_012191 [Steinernema carpocapsae]|uniref:Uncharacterized protein n=1 Tax=Steinernema carpocapsae TaxID=34508 RepID=A0A4U5NWI9_STECR|nr:hypothetical protein L596_012191 [Steinernema carpocapsae]